MTNTIAKVDLGAARVASTLLYLDKLSNHKSAQVIVFQDQKAADRAQDLLTQAGIYFKQVVTVALDGEARAIDVSPLYGRNVCLWPRSGEAGEATMLEVGRLLKSHVEGNKLRVFLGDPDEIHQEDFDLLGYVKAEHAKTLFSWFESRLNGVPTEEVVADPEPATDKDAELEQPVDVDASIQTQGLTAARDEERRQQQKDENSRIQDIDCGVMFPSKLSVDEMAEHLYWVAEGELVAHVSDDRTMFLKYNEVRSLTAESVTFVEADKGKKKPTPNAVIWKGDYRRKNVMVPTFHAGAGVVCADPDGRRAVNIWRPMKRWESKADTSLFLDHVEYLIEDDDERGVFFDWLAHLEQKPGELPHYGWLHVARHTGCGRNWLASVLARVWRGYVAPNVDLHALLDSAYNGVLSGRVLAMVDEIQAGGSDNYGHTNRLRSLLNQEVRNMNPKFGREYREHNACRWLVFSNHLNALPIDNTDRRWRVVVHNKPPRAAEDYVKLYEALNNPEFINSVAVFLAKRDISKFKPGERPPMSKAKLSVVGASKTLSQQRAEAIVEHWPSDIITNADVATILSEGASSYIDRSMRRCLEELDAVAIGRQIKIAGIPSRVWVIRNHENWHDGSGNADIVKEVQRARGEARDGRCAQTVLAEAMEVNIRIAEADRQQAGKASLPTAASQPVVSAEHPFK